MTLFPPPTRDLVLPAQTQVRESWHTTALTESRQHGAWIRNIPSIYPGWPTHNPRVEFDHFIPKSTIYSFAASSLPMRPISLLQALLPRPRLPWMYIPRITSRFLDPPDGVAGAGQGSLITHHRHHSEPSDNPVLFLIRQFVASLLDDALSAASHGARAGARAPGLRKRDVNTTIGVTVAILLAVFLVAFFSFLHIYRHSIRFTFRKKRRHHKSVGSPRPDGAGAQGESPAG
ncbi:hypothetical protein F4775DRAFT_595837 [Biscogniauxia sp. FL1348]|nr:hypothetical protein F4775DRAFT_595837 [Biscogniauxia sp. FL1348]